MCMFSGKVEFVADTRIFGRVENDRQYLVYQMEFTALTELAMILPLPTRTSAEDQVEFVSLAGYGRFFREMDRCFASRWEGSLSMPMSMERTDPVLPVHRVGSFEASYVPHHRDFSRLDPRFRFSDDAWTNLSQYEDFGFAVFKLRAGKSRVHPMALSFLTRAPQRLYFPTTHLHDGTVHDRALFHHTLYAQGIGVRGQWQQSRVLPSSAMDRKNAGMESWTRGLVAPEKMLVRRDLNGVFPNEDIWQALA